MLEQCSSLNSSSSSQSVKTCHSTEEARAKLWASIQLQVKEVTVQPAEVLAKALPAWSTLSDDGHLDSKTLQGTNQVSTNPN